MSGNGKQDSTQTSNLFNKQRDLGPVFPGKPHLNNQPNPTNLAVKRSLIEIFDEFTHVISGELKSMNLEQFESDQKKRK
jgi:hypothetical protein